MSSQHPPKRQREVDLLLSSPPRSRQKTTPSQVPSGSGGGVSDSNAAFDAEVAFAKDVMQKKGLPALLDDDFSDAEHRVLDKRILNSFARIFVYTLCYSYSSYGFRSGLTTIFTWQRPLLNEQEIIDDELKEDLLRALNIEILTCPKLDNTIGDKMMKNPAEWIKQYPWLLKEVYDGFYSEPRTSRRLRLFRVLRLKSTLNDDVVRSPAEIQRDEASEQATLHSWTSQFRGNSADLFRDILEGYFALPDNSHYARYVAFTQSSGTGKSRINDELAKHVVSIPLNLAKGGATSYPPADGKARDWLMESNPPGQNFDLMFVQRRYHAFIYAMLTQFASAKTKADTLKRLALLASAFRSQLSDGGTFTMHGLYRDAFYKDVCALADKTFDAYKQPTTPKTYKDNSPVFKGSPNDEDDAARAGRLLWKFLDPNGSCQNKLLALFVLDESHSLTEPVQGATWTFFSEMRRVLRKLRNRPFFSVFLSTVSKFHQISPDYQHDASDRVRGYELTLFPPITETGFDQFADPISQKDGTWTLERVASTYHIAHLGRALFPALYDKGNADFRAGIVNYAAFKLLCGRPSALDDEQKLACIAVRLGVDFRATTWLQRDAERKQVERHMRICLAATAGFHEMVTIAPSEPLLAEAAYTYMNGWDVAGALLKHIESSYLSVGDRGELIATLILLLARDRAIRNRAPDAPYLGECREKDLMVGGSKRVGDLDELRYDGAKRGRIVTVWEFITALLPEAIFEAVGDQIPSIASNTDDITTLQEAFEDCHIWCNHFIKVEDYDMINQKNLWRLVSRGAGVVCANNHRGIDILVPALFGTVLKANRVSAILIQVRNDKSYTHNIRSAVFANMDPFKVGLFTTDDSPLPVIRMVFALTSKKAAVTRPALPTRKSGEERPRKGRFTTYDIWCAGLSHETFAVIDPSLATNLIYDALLLRSQVGFDSYNVTFSTGDKMSGERARARRMMNPGASSKPRHHVEYAPDDVHVVELDDSIETEELVEAICDE